MTPIIGENGVAYLNTENIIDRRVSLAPRNRRQDGYGSKIPISAEIRLKDKRWRRVYVVCWSNSGSRYVLVNGKPQYIASHVDL